jgi:hypothetical protein
MYSNMSNQLALVSYGQAERLKKLGFDWRCLYWYRKDDARHEYPFEAFEKNYNEKEDCLSAPPLALALKWMRDEKSLFAAIRPYPGDDNELWFVFESFGSCINPDYAGSYEDAESRLLDELLTFLEKENEQ